MEQLSLLIIFWYGILHAFAPDHLTAIADFSIGKNRKKTMLITILFAFGHGISLLILAKILEAFTIPAEILAYGDVISASVILGMGVYLLFLVFTNRINIHKHIHNNKEHVHIYFGTKHQHNEGTMTSAFTIGTLMGIGGVRGMLVTLGLVESSQIDLTMVFAFTSGVVLIFLFFGVGISYINQNLLKSTRNVKTAFTTIGSLSVIVGLNMLIS